MPRVRPPYRAPLPHSSSSWAARSLGIALSSLVEGRPVVGGRRVVGGGRGGTVGGGPPWRELFLPVDIPEDTPLLVFPDTRVLTAARLGELDTDDTLPPPSVFGSVCEGLPMTDPLQVELAWALALENCKPVSLFKGFFGTTSSSNSDGTNSDAECAFPDTGVADPLGTGFASSFATIDNGNGVQQSPWRLTLEPEVRESLEEVTEACFDSLAAVRQKMLEEGYVAPPLHYFLQAYRLVLRCASFIEGEKKENDDRTAPQDDGSTGNEKGTERVEKTDALSIVPFLNCLSFVDPTVGARRRSSGSGARVGTSATNNLDVAKVSREEAQDICTFYRFRGARQAFYRPRCRKPLSPDVRQELTKHADLRLQSLAAGRQKGTVKGRRKERSALGGGGDDELDISALDDTTERSVHVDYFVVKSVKTIAQGTPLRLGSLSCPWDGDGSTNTPLMMSSAQLKALRYFYGGW